MPLVLADMEDELKNRMRTIGAFAAASSADRLRYALRKAAFQAWTRQDWDFKNSTATISTSAGTLGPYNAPAGLVRFATVQRKAFFGYVDKDILAPILSSDSTDWTPYIKVQDGKIYFIQDPGEQSLTLNYLAAFSNGADEATLAASLLHIDDGLNDAINVLAEADIRKDLPGGRAEAVDIQKEGLQLADDYWEEVTRDRYQKTISPKGLNRVPVDFSARVITVMGVSIAGSERVL